MPTVQRRVADHLAVLVEEIGARPPGSEANRRATAYVRTVLDDLDLEVVEHPFETVWWEPGDGSLTVAGGIVPVSPNPYSPAGDVRGPVRRAGDLQQLDALDDCDGRVLVLAGELTREQLLPTAFPYLDWPSHTRLREALRRLAPAAVVAVSDHWQPILEDPELGFPSTTVTERVGAQLREGAVVRLVVGGAVHAGHGTTVSGRTDGRGPRVVLSAHLDSKSTTPGAFDNAAGVAAVLGAAATGLADVGPCEVVLFNGEDHFDACGEVAWFAATDLADVLANVNVDGVGLAGAGSSLTSLACPPAVEGRLADWVGRRPCWTPADPWMESDHAIFAMQGVPAVAVTTQDVHQRLRGIAHTAADTLDVLDLDVVEDVADALPELVDLLHRAAPRDRARRPAH